MTEINLGRARTYLQTPLQLQTFLPNGQWNRSKKTEGRHLTDHLNWSVMELKYP